MIQPHVTTSPIDVWIEKLIPRPPFPSLPNLPFLALDLLKGLAWQLGGPRGTCAARRSKSLVMEFETFDMLEPK